MTSIELKHVSDDDANDLQVSNEEDEMNGRVKWIDTTPVILKALSKLFSDKDQLSAAATCLRIVLQQAHDN